MKVSARTKKKSTTFANGRGTLKSDSEKQVVLEKNDDKFAKELEVQKQYIQKVMAEKNQLLLKNKQVSELAKSLNTDLLLQINAREKELEEFIVLQKKYMSLEKKYHALSSSKLGKMTLYYWELLKKVRGRKNVRYRKFAKKA